MGCPWLALDCPPVGTCSKYCPFTESYLIFIIISVSRPNAFSISGISKILTYDMFFIRQKKFFWLSPGVDMHRDQRGKDGDGRLLCFTDKRLLRWCFVQFMFRSNLSTYKVFVLYKTFISFNYQASSIDTQISFKVRRNRRTEWYNLVYHDYFEFVFSNPYTTFQVLMKQLIRKRHLLPTTISHFRNRKMSVVHY